MVGIMTVVELLGKVAHLACLSLCKPGFVYQCVMHILENSPFALMARRTERCDWNDS